jgi:hypothetical protein
LKPLLVGFFWHACLIYVYLLVSKQFMGIIIILLSPIDVCFLLVVFLRRQLVDGAWMLLLSASTDFA